MFKKLSGFISNKFFNLKFKYQLLATYLLISLIPLMILGIFSFNQSRSLLFSSKEKDVNFYFDKANITLNNTIQTCEEIAQEVATNPQFLRIFNNEFESEKQLKNQIVSALEPHLYNLESFYPFIREITFYTKQDIKNYRTVIHDYDDLTLPKHFSKDNEQWYFDGKSLIYKYDIYDDKVHTGSLCVFMWPKSLIKTAGVEFMNYNLLLTTNDIKMVYYRNIDHSDPAPNLEKFINIEDKEIEMDSKEYLVLSSTLKNNLKLFAYAPKSDIVEGSSTILHSTFIAILLSFILLLIIDVIFSVAFTKRINHLSKQISLIKNGDLSVRLYSSQKDEIGTLTNGISDMTQRLDSLIHTVYEKEIQQKRFELKALQAQINPHFLYNTLQTINWIAIDNDADEISELVINLSNFYRATLNNNEDESTVEDEIKMIKSYLDIEKIVLGNKFDVEFDVDDLVLNNQTIHLILQPLTENAIEHGVKKSRKRKCTIKVSAKKVQNKLVFSVSDDGPGIQPDKIDTLLTSSSKGYGLKNVNERIKIKYGEEYGLIITSAESPTTFTITLPLM